MNACAPVSTASRQTAAGAGGSGARLASPAATLLSDQAGPPPLTLKDTSPANLSVSLYLMVGGYDSASRNITELAIGFTSHGQRVQFIANERIRCNGKAVPGAGGSFDTKLPTEILAGRPVICTYTSGQATAAITFTAPPALTILSPEDQATVPRSHRTIVRFLMGGHTTMSWVTALGPHTKTWSYPAGASPTQVVLDTSAFPPGPGSITLSQFFSLPDLQGAGFESVDGRGGAVQQNAVTWA